VPAGGSWAPARTPDQVEHISPNLEDWTVGEVVLYESRLSPRGASYSALARVPLAAG
jgi:2'-5' RNA ligase